jgi:hypothetical protein
MRIEVKREDVEAAIEDVKSRTLAGLPGDLARLIYIASTRDYNTGHYYHEGLAMHFTEEVARRALAACHQEIFDRLAPSLVEDLVKQLETYVSSTHARPVEVLEAWKKLEPYRVTIPLECAPLAAEFFFSNVRIGLAILQARQDADPQS